MEHRDMQEFSFSDIRVHPSLITDLLDKSEDVELMLRRKGDRVTVCSNGTGSEAETGTMTLKDLTEKTVSILRYFEENADSIMEDLKPGKCSGLLEVMNRLAKRMDALDNKTELLTIANIMYDLTLEIPHFPPDDEPPQHYRPEDLKPENSRDRIESYKATLMEAFTPCFKRIEQAWRAQPSIIPETASKGPKEPDWELIKSLKDDPSWDEFFEEIERERDRDIWTGEEAV